MHCDVTHVSISSCQARFELYNGSASALISLIILISTLSFVCSLSELTLLITIKWVHTTSRCNRHQTSELTINWIQIIRLKPFFVQFIQNCNYFGCLPLKKSVFFIFETNQISLIFFLAGNIFTSTASQQCRVFCFWALQSTLSNLDLCKYSKLFNTNMFC